MSKTALRKLLQIFVQNVPIRGRDRLISYLNPYLVPQDYVIEVLLEGGQKMLLDLRDRIQRSIYYYGGYEFAETKLIRSLLSPQSIFFDIGANIGYYTLIAAKQVSSGGAVHSFEPIPDNFERLQRNVQVNNYKNVFLNQVAVSSCNGTTFIAKPKRFEDDSGGATFFRDNPDGRLSVRTICLDSYIDEHGINEIDLIKMDVEGAEVLVLEGMKSTLAQGKVVSLVCEVNGYWLQQAGTSEIELKRLLAEYGYEVFRISNRGLKEVAVDEHHSHVENLYFTRT